jgi:hypothetical protein
MTGNFDFNYPSRGYKKESQIKDSAPGLVLMDLPDHTIGIQIIYQSIRNIS